MLAVTTLVLRSIFSFCPVYLQRAHPFKEKVMLQPTKLNQSTTPHTPYGVSETKTRGGKGMRSKPRTEQHCSRRNSNMPEEEEEEKTKIGIPARPIGNQKMRTGFSFLFSPFHNQHLCVPFPSCPLGLLLYVCTLGTP